VCFPARVETKEAMARPRDTMSLGEAGLSAAGVSQVFYRFNW